jgi:hypothetical protein
MARDLIHSINHPTSDDARCVSDALTLQGLVERHGYDQVRKAVSSLRMVNDDVGRLHAVSSRFRDLARSKPAD